VNEPSTIAYQKLIRLRTVLIAATMLLAVPMTSVISARAEDPGPDALKLAMDKATATAAAAERNLEAKRSAAKAAASAYSDIAAKIAVANATLAINEPLLGAKDTEVATRAALAVKAAYETKEAGAAAKLAWAKAEAEVKVATRAVTAARAAESAARTAWEKAVAVKAK
jgi:hypothetical protein